MVAVGVYAVEHGDPARVMAPLDADGKFCGIDYPDYPYLYYQDIDHAVWFPWAVCVRECPM